MHRESTPTTTCSACAKRLGDDRRIANWALVSMALYRGEPDAALLYWTPHRQLARASKFSSRMDRGRIAKTGGVRSRKARRC